MLYHLLSPYGGDLNLFKLDVQRPAEMLAGAQFYYMWVP